MTEPFSSTVWEDVAADPVQTGVVLRRVRPDLPHDVFVGESRPDKLLLLRMDIVGAPGAIPARRPSAVGLGVKVDDSSKQRTRLELVARTPAVESLFQDLAADLVLLLVEEPGEGAASRVVERLIAWQDFLARSKDSFGPERAAGLIAELLVLSTAFVPALGHFGAATAWTGPDPAIQDFQSGAVALEAKSYRGNPPGSMKISSERQLDLTGTEQLFVGYAELDQRADGTGKTVLDFINEVRQEFLASPAARQLLDSKLLQSGWRDEFADIRTERYEVRALELFEVVQGFPRIVPDDLGVGVGGVSYSIDRSAAEPFVADWTALVDLLKENM